MSTRRSSRSFCRGAGRARAPAASLGRLVADSLAPAHSTHAVAYEALHRNLPGASFIFMNHGFADLDEGGMPLPRRADTRHRYHLRLLQEVVAGASVRDGEVLEVGCGRGGNCVALRRRHAARRVVGLDCSPLGLRFCLEQHRQLGLGFVQGSALALPFADARFDCVVNIESSHCYPNVEAFVGEAWRVIRPGGMFCYADGIASRRVAARTALLQRRGFLPRRVADVTDNVAEAIRRGADAYRRTLLEAAASPAGVEEAESLASNIAGAMLDAYVSGRTRYMIWQLTRPG